jgi:hypothetical protein
MCKGHNLNPIVGNSIHNLEWKAAEKVAANAVHEQRPAFWRFRDGFDPMIDLGEEGIRSGLTSFEVPLPSSLGLFNCVRMENKGGPGASATEDLSASITPRNNTIRRCVDVL